MGGLWGSAGGNRQWEIANRGPRQLPPPPSPLVGEEGETSLSLSLRETEAQIPGQKQKEKGRRSDHGIAKKGQERNKLRGVG